MRGQGLEGTVMEGGVVYQRFLGAHGLVDFQRVQRLLKVTSKVGRQTQGKECAGQNAGLNGSLPLDTPTCSSWPYLPPPTHD